MPPKSGETKKKRVKVQESTLTPSAPTEFEDRDMELITRRLPPLLDLDAGTGPLRIRLGLCCINNQLRNAKPTVFCSLYISGHYIGPVLYQGFKTRRPDIYYWRIRLTYANVFYWYKIRSSNICKTD